MNYKRFLRGGRMTKPLFPVDDKGLEDVAEELADKNFEEKRALEQLGKIKQRYKEFAKAQEQLAKAIGQKAAQQPAQYNPPQPCTQPSLGAKVWKKTKTGLKIAGIVLGGTVIIMGISIGCPRAVYELTEKDKPSADCLETVDYVGLWGKKVVMNTCIGKFTDLTIGRDDDTVRYVDLPGNDTIVDSIYKYGREYKREEGYQSMFQEADASWENYWNAAELGDAVNEWHAWRKARGLEND